jgi:hypothetical protein
MGEQRKIKSGLSQCKGAGRGLPDYPAYIFGVLVCRRAQKRASTSFTVTFLGSGNIYRPMADWTIKK